MRYFTIDAHGIVDIDTDYMHAAFPFERVIVADKDKENTAVIFSHDTDDGKKHTNVRLADIGKISIDDRRRVFHIHVPGAEFQDYGFTVFVRKPDRRLVEEYEDRLPECLDPFEGGYLEGDE